MITIGCILDRKRSPNHSSESNTGGMPENETRPTVITENVIKAISAGAKAFITPPIAG
jgi:hypothetical protein